MRRLLLLAASCFLASLAYAQTYSLPNNNASCPASCRQIPWVAGSDLWNGGALPTYAQVTCSPLNENGSTDDTTNINNCITAANAGTGAYATCHAAGGCAVFLPAGTILINGTVRLKNNVVLRGAGTTSTQINEGASGFLTTQNFSYSSISGYNGFATFPSPSSLSGSPQKGDTTVTIGSGSVSVGTWIKVFGNDDPTLINDIGTDGTCNWCGDNSGWYVQQQMVQVTGFVSGSGGVGSVVNISRPLYYTPSTTSVTIQGQVELAGAKYNTITFPTQKAGFENFKVTATGDIGGSQIILLQGCLYCWVNGVETQTTGSNSGSAHVEMDFTYGSEVRNSYLHDQRSGASGSGYGVYFQFVNGDAKIENNTMRHNRHWIVYQGGGSGTAILYNYADDNYTDDLAYMGSGRTSHGAHPYFNLFEGNVISHIAADDFWGTSSHDVFWRNWIWGDETENWTVPSPGVDAPTPGAGNPNEAFDAVDLYTGQEYYAFVGNVLGTQSTTSIPTGANNSCAVTSTIARHAIWSSATLSGFDEFAAPTTPIVYSYGGALGSSASSSATVIRNGNYDYKTNGVAFWDGGSTNNTFANSLYYGSKPAFLGTCRWPVVGYDQSPVYSMNAAQAAYLGANVNAPSVISSGQLSNGAKILNGAALQ